MSRLGAQWFPLLWSLLFVIIVIGDLGVGSILVLPLALLLIPYYLFDRGLRRPQSHRSVLLLLGYWLTVLIMVLVMAWMIAATFGFALRQWPGPQPNRS